MKRDDHLTTYTDLLIEADNNNLITKEKCLLAHKGRIKGNRIAIKKDMTTAEKACVLAEELGHYYTATGDILDMSKTENRKLENKGRIVAYNKLIGLSGLVNVYKNHCSTVYEASECLNVPEDFFCDALSYYKSKCGDYAIYENYIIIFEPNLAIINI